MVKQRVEGSNIDMRRYAIYADTDGWDVLTKLMKFWVRGGGGGGVKKKRSFCVHVFARFHTR